MSADFAYMTNSKNLKAIFDRIHNAGAPPRFTLEFLKSLGFASSSDRPVINVLRSLGFLDSSGVPTERYNAFRDGHRRGLAVADGLREGWADLFLIERRANEKSSAQLTELFKSASGKGEAAAQKMATTFKVLAEMADWTAQASTAAAVEPLTSTPQHKLDESAEPERASLQPERTRLMLHHDVHVHLPSTSDVAVYTAIFRALRAELLD